VPSSTLSFDLTDSLRQIQQALRQVRDALRRAGVDEQDSANRQVFGLLRDAERLTAEALARLDSGQTVSADEFEVIAGLFGSIKAIIF